MEKLNVLLGAGFSVDAGLPLVSGINKAFDQDLRGKLIRHSGSEWSWVVEGHQINDYVRRSPNAVVIEYILNEAIKLYKIDKRGFISYEDFYSFLIGKDRNWFEDLYAKGAEQFIADHLEKNPDYDPRKYDSYKYFGQKNIQEIFHSFQFLLEALLGSRMNKEELRDLYQSFFNFLTNYKEVNFCSLNHDLELERLLVSLDIPFRNGFSTANSPLRDADGLLIPVFNNDFERNYRVIKLHGSINLIRFVVADPQGHKLQSTGELIYCIPQDRHRIERRDFKTGDVLQNLNIDIAPSFLTGVTKKESIKNDYMYSELFSRFHREIGFGDHLIIGYSFSDDHINSVLQQQEITGRMVNVNPSKRYPFQAENIVNISHMNELPDVVLT